MSHARGLSSDWELGAPRKCWLILAEGSAKMGTRDGAGSAGNRGSTHLTNTAGLGQNTASEIS